MINERTGHSTVAIKNKLFVIGGFGTSYVDRKACEMFDSSCKKFVSFKQKPLSTSVNYMFVSHVQSFSIGSKLITIGYGSGISGIAFCYDVEKHQWTLEPFKVSEDSTVFECIVVPKM